MEIWVDVIDYDGVYKISNEGRVKSLRFNKEKIMKPIARATDGRLGLSLRKNNTPEYFKIHQLVATHFLDKPNGKFEINHIDGNYLNNNADNLEWVTREENLIHAKENKLTRIGLVGESNLSAKLTELDVKEIRKIYSETKMPQIKIANMYGVSRSCIRHVIDKSTWKHVN